MTKQFAFLLLVEIQFSFFYHDYDSIRGQTMLSKQIVQLSQFIAMCPYIVWMDRNLDKDIIFGHLSPLYARAAPL